MSKDNFKKWTGYDYKMWHCKCLTCQLVSEYVLHGEVDKYGNGHTIEFEKPCDMCIMFNNKARTVKGKIYIPQEVKEFLGIEVICEFCLNVINAYVQCDFRLCWAKASKEAIQLALLRLIRGKLRRLAYSEIYRKRIITRCINKGEVLPEWAENYQLA